MPILEKVTVKIVGNSMVFFPALPAFLSQHSMVQCGRSSGPVPSSLPGTQREWSNAVTCLDAARGIGLCFANSEVKQDKVGSSYFRLGRAWKAAMVNS